MEPPQLVNSFLLLPKEIYRYKTHLRFKILLLFAVDYCMLYLQLLRRPLGWYHP